jgi:hypothetical protein
MITWTLFAVKKKFDFTEAPVLWRHPFYGGLYFVEVPVFWRSPFCGGPEPTATVPPPLKSGPANHDNNFAM